MVEDNHVTVNHTHYIVPITIIVLQDILKALDVLKSSVKQFVSLYCSSYTPGYIPKWEESGGCGQCDDITRSHGTLRIKVAALHRVQLNDIVKSAISLFIYILIIIMFRYSSVQVEVGVYYGGRSLAKRTYSPHAKLSRDFFDCVVWDKWYVIIRPHPLSCMTTPTRLNLGIELRNLLPETRILFTLYGVELQPDSSHNRTTLAWAALRLFNTHR